MNDSTDSNAATEPNAGQSPDTNHTVDPQKQKIMEILAHRRMLLERVRLCKKASENRLQLYQDVGASDENEPSTSQNVATGTDNFVVVSRKKKFSSKEEEIKSYKDLCDHAMSFTVKKEPVVKVPVPPTPRAISLRTGSGVGNKMKAAVATLTSNTGWVSDSSTNSNLNPNLALNAHTVNSKQMTMTSSAGPLHLNGTMGSFQALPEAPPSSALPISNSKNIGKQLKKKTSFVTKKKNVKTPGVMVSATDLTSNSSIKLQQGIKGERGTPIGKEHLQPKVICPEAERLRRNRKSIISKLDNLVQSAYSTARTTHTDSSHLVNKSVMQHSKMTSEDNPYCSGTRLTWSSFVEMNKAPIILPTRQKSHWDYVMEEMRWLATDFVEERKWKVAGCKAISSAVRKYHKEAENNTMSKLKASQTPKTSPASSVHEEVKNTSTKEEKVVDVQHHEDSESESSHEQSISALTRESDIEFVDPSEDDLAMSKSISTAISKLMESNWDNILAISGNNDVENLDALSHKRYNTAIPIADNMDDAVCNTSFQERKQNTFTEIEEMLGQCSCTIEKHRSSPPSTFDEFRNEVGKSTAVASIELLDNQLEILQYIERIWEEEKHSYLSGSIIAGPVGCGKTIATATLLWRRRELGPQLLLSPTASMIRWKHELSRFKGLNVLLCGSEGFISGNNDEEVLQNLPTCSLVLCDLSGLDYIISKLSFIKFVTVAIDSRCSSFLPLQTSEFDDKENVLDSHKKYASQPADQRYTNIVAKELMDPYWWNKVIGELVHKDTKCALIEFSGFVQGHLLPILQESKAGIIAAKAAFIYHSIFHSKKNTFVRRAFWWAKKHTSKQSDGLDAQIPTVINKCLQEILNQVSSSSLNPKTTEMEERVMTSAAKWTVQLCDFSVNQRRAYAQACAYVKGSLQSDYGACSKALLRLRRTCFHSDLHDLVSTASKSKQPFSKAFDFSHRKNLSKTNPSQPDSSLAKSLMDHSSKLQHLFQVLTNDCGFVIADKNFLLDTKGHRVSKKKQKSSNRKKVLILASLPEVLLMISTFLNAIGISHELISSFNGVDPNYQSDAKFDLSTHDTSWKRDQEALLRFDSVISEEKDFNTVDVLVSCTFSLSSTSLGMGAASAEVIISMDEDWSGQTDLSMYSVLMKSETHNLRKGIGKKYIKLVSENSCEKSFLTYEKKGRGKKTILANPFSASTLTQWKMDPFGHFLSSDCLTFGQNILRCCNMSLEVVFSGNGVFSYSSLNGISISFLPHCSSQLNERAKKYDSDLPDGDKFTVILRSVFDNDPEEFNIRNCIKFAKALTFVERIAINGGKPLPLPRTQNPSSLILYLNQTQAYVSFFANSCGNDSNSDVTQTIQRPTHHTSSTIIDVTLDDDKSVESLEPLTKVISERSPDDIALSLILYKRNVCDVIDFTDIEGPCKKRRINSYVTSYNTMWKNFDGNQGQEALLYHPPLFPGIIHFRKTEKENMQLPFGNTYDDIDGSKALTRVLPAGNPRNSKKLRASDPYRLNAAGPSNVSKDADPIKDNDFNFMTDNDPDADFMANDFFDGDDLFPDINISKDEALTNNIGLVDNDILPPQENTEENVTMDTAQASLNLDEDFGLLGSGYLPPLEESMISASNCTKLGNGYSFWSDFLELPLTNTALLEDEVDSVKDASFLSAIVLSVKKSTSYPNRVFSHSPSQNASKRFKGANFDLDLQLSSLGLSMKDILKSSPKGDPFNAIDAQLHRGLPFVNFHRNLQRMINLSVFNHNDDVDYTTPSIIRELLPNENTGNAAMVTAAMQREAFDHDNHRSQHDGFGPFSALSLPDNSLQDTSDLLSSRDGIKLPMGVKVPKAKSSLTSKDVWDKHSNELLNVFAEKYQYNWHIVSQAMTRKTICIRCVDNILVTNPTRSARECKEQWLTMNPTKTDAIPTPVTPTDQGNDHEGKPKAILINRAFFEKVDCTETEQVVSDIKPSLRSRLQRIKRGQAKKTAHPLPIPRYNGDPNGPVQVMPSHHSHAQSVQSAIALSAQPSGIVPPRAEMWPLQFLDLTEKQRAHVEKMKNAQAQGNLPSPQPTSMSPVRPNQGNPTRPPAYHPPPQHMPSRSVPPPPQPPPKYHQHVQKTSPPKQNQPKGPG